jgi:hypothetical protein
MSKLREDSRYVAHTGEMKNAYKIFVRKREGQATWEFQMWMEE